MDAYICKVKFKCNLIISRWRITVLSHTNQNILYLRRDWFIFALLSMTSRVTRWLEYFYYLTTYNNSNLPKIHNNLANVGSKFSQTLNIPSKVCLRFWKFAPWAKFRQIWSHWWRASMMILPLSLWFSLRIAFSRKMISLLHLISSISFGGETPPLNSVTIRQRTTQQMKTGWAAVVAQLVERSLPTPEVRSSNPVIGKIYVAFNTVNCIEKFFLNPQAKWWFWGVFKRSWWHISLM